MTGAVAITKKDVTLPVVYTTAVKALAECCNLNEAATFVDAAEALAVWAKIYKHNEAGRQARQLRLHAHRRMGILARELAPGDPIKGGGRQPGPIAKLREHGLTRHQADAANHLAKMDRDGFDELVNQDIPPAPTSVTRRFREPKQMTMWKSLRQRPRTPFSCAVFIEKNAPDALALMLRSHERNEALKIVDDLIKWLQAFRVALRR